MDLFFIPAKDGIFNQLRVSSIQQRDRAGLVSLRCKFAKRGNGRK